MDLVPCKVHLCFSWSVFDGFELIRIFGRAVGRGGASRCHWAPSAPHGVKVVSRENDKTGIANLLAALAQETLRMLIPNLLAALAQEPPRMLALRIRVLAPRWFEDVPESSFSEFLGISHQVAPGSPQKVHFNHFRALAAN